MIGEISNISVSERLVCDECLLPSWSFRINDEENARTAPSFEEAAESIREAAELAIEHLKEARQRGFIEKVEDA